MLSTRNRPGSLNPTSDVSEEPPPPLRDPEHYQYDVNLRDITEVWRRGSVIASWLLDLTAAALVKDSELSGFSGRVSDSGEGRWTIKAEIDEAVPLPVLSACYAGRPASVKPSAKRAARPESRTFTGRIFR